MAERLAVRTTWALRSSALLPQLPLWESRSISCTPIDRRVALPVAVMVGVGAGSPTLSVQPAVARLDRKASITVTGVEAGSLEARLAGATRPDGNSCRGSRSPTGMGFGEGRSIRPHFVVCTWCSCASAVAGRCGSHRGGCSACTRGARALVLPSPRRKALDAGGPFCRRRRAEGLETVASAGLRPAGSCLHQLIVIAYGPAGTLAIVDRLGMFVTAVRETFDGRWRLLEANVFP